MTLREWFEQVPNGRKAYYKECEITDVNPVGEHHAYIEVQIPLPVGGRHQLLVEMETEVEVRSGE
jgi:hypothetical protein